MRTQTRRSYAPVLNEFRAFAAELPPATTDEELDERLVDFADHSHFEGKPSVYGTKLKVAIADENPRFSRHGKGRLPLFARALQAWTRLPLGKTRPPLPWLHLVLIVLDLLHDGLAMEALCFLMTFVCYFRPGESLAVQAQDVVKPSPPVHTTASIQLHPEARGETSKTGFFDDGVPLDSSVIPELGSLLVELSQVIPPSQPLFGLSCAHVKRAFETVCDKLNIPDRSMYRLRHGGASHDRASNSRSLAEIKKRGRWAADSSARRYERSVRLQQVEQSVSHQLLEFARAHADSLRLPSKTGQALLPRAMTRRIERALRHKDCVGAWIAFPCQAFSRAHLRPASATQRRQVSWLARMAQTLGDRGCVVAFENPLNSRIWAVSHAAQLVDKCGFAFARFDHCMFGAPWRKATCVAYRNAPGLCDAARQRSGRGRCERSGKHHFVRLLHCTRFNGPSAAHLYLGGRDPRPSHRVFRWPPHTLPQCTYESGGGMMNISR